MTNKLRSLKDVDVKNKTVIVRANLDVPIKNGEILDETRVDAAIPTLKHLIENNCKIVVIAHLGRPEGQYVDELSLMPIRFALGRHLEKQIKFVNIEHCENSIKFLEPKDVLLLENIRFSPQEESTEHKTRLQFVKKLSEMADLYINDCFGVYKRHASVYELPQIMKSVAGFEFEKEVEVLTKIKEEAESPYVAILGGAKLDSKISAVKALVKQVDTILMGGSAAYTFLKAKGVKIGDSKYEKSLVKEAKAILELANKNKCEIILPVDHIAGKEFNENAKPVQINDKNIPDGMVGMDIGPETIKMYQQKLLEAKTILWNGPMGVFEWENFSKGTSEIGDFIALSTPKETFKVAGGGDTTMAIKNLKIKSKRFNHISVGGGMSLEFLSGKKFDLIDILTGKQKIVKQ